MDAIISTSAVVDVVRDYACSVAKEEFKSVWYLEDEIDRISKKVATIRAQGEDAEKKQLQDEDVGKWVRDLKNADYDMEDVQCDYRAVVSSEVGQGVLAWLMRLAKDGLCLACGIPLSCLKIIPAPVTPRIEIAHRLRSINRSLDEINQRKAKLSLDGGMAGEGNESVTAGPSLWPYQKWPMIGRTETKSRIKEALLNYAVAVNEGSCSNLFVVGIVGAGGMGKTTLAHSIFNDEDVVAAFSNKKWVYVGDKFDIKRVMNEIIGGNSHLVHDDDLQSAMEKKFRDQNLLIVLDDAWCDESGEWELLQSSLSKGEKAHALIVTTRNKAVARAISHESKYLEHELLGLPDTECMEIFKRRAFMGEQAERYLDDLEGLSKQVALKLKGNPLAATMMGTFLHKHLGNRRMWINIVNDVIGWPHTHDGNVVDRVVGLSYLHLPPKLKLCFAYYALFPKGFRFDKMTLVQMWIAQGYVDKSPPGGLMEHSGSDHFDDLYQRSFFQFESSYGGGLDYYIMHDLIHDFAQKVFTEGCQMDASDTEDGTSYEEIRHLSVYFNRIHDLSVHRNGTEPLKRLHNFKKLRTLMLTSYLTTDRLVPLNVLVPLDVLVPLNVLVPLDVLAKFKYLFLLVLKDRKLSEFPDSIRHLQFLRYLDISWTAITALPEFVCDLVKLQFLILPYRYALPEGMNKLTNLRFIAARSVNHIEGVRQFKGIGMLKSLQGCITTFEVKNESGWKISELKGLKYLHGKLFVGGLENVTCREEAEQACLTQKMYLEELELDWSIEEVWIEEEEEEEEEEMVDAVESQVQQHVRNEGVEGQVLEGLCPPPNLKVLRIYNNRGARFPSWMEERCPISSSLVTLELYGCFNWECLPTLGRWPYLKELIIIGAHGVKKIGPKFYGGTDDGCRVEILRIEDMSLWEGWEMSADEEIHSGGGGRHVFPCLKKLIIKDCSKLASLPPILRHSTNLETLQIWRCAELGLSWEEGDGCGWMSPSSLKELDIGECPKLASLAPILHHSTNLESLKISRCAELASLDGCGSTLPSRLKKLIIKDCPKLASLPPILRHSTNLEASQIWQCAELGLSWEEGDGCGSTLPSSLKELHIGECPKLASLAPIVHHSTNLEKLGISGCAELASLEGCGPTLPSGLKHLTISNCPKLVSLAPILHHSTNLESLVIWECAELASLEGCGPTLPSGLKHLTISKCPELVSPAPILHHSTNLESLVIWGCAELASLDGWGSTLPSSLKELHISYYPKLDSLAPILRHLTNLESLKISGCGDQQQLGLSWEEEGDDERGWMLPSGLKRLSIDECSWKLIPSLSHLTALQELTIWGFPNLRCIPPSIDSLRSLERLQIVYCPAIESLPDGGLPPSLRSLYIVQCPLLQGRCEEGRPDRPKIPTTTKVYFDRIAVGPVQWLTQGEVWGSLGPP